MAEAILALYSGNTWSRLHTTKTKRRIHWILQVIGSAMIIVGLVYEYNLHRRHFRDIHAITGKSYYFILNTKFANTIKRII